jgi:hypothetical protein
MNPHPPDRTKSCDRHAALARLSDALAQFQLAELAPPTSDAAERKAATSCAVLAGIAAADAACCAGLGRRSRSQDHRDAVSLLSMVPGGGAQASVHLGRLLSAKSTSQYSMEIVTAQKHSAAVRQARALIAFATRVVDP